MADSNITKQALSVALKELLEEQSFEKISVSDICERCRMNRKSFYYHFKDRYDLVNWIFDTEFIALTRECAFDTMAKQPPYSDRWRFIEVVCNYFYANRHFYSRVLSVQGQNSFSEHFREFLLPPLRNRIGELVGHKDLHPMCVDFFADGIVCTFERWLQDKECMKPEEFVSILQNLIQVTATSIHSEMNEK